MDTDNKACRSYRAIVEAAGAFDGLRRVRLSIPNNDDDKVEDKNKLSQLKRALATSLGLSDHMTLAMEVEIFDPQTESFLRLVNGNGIPTSTCRLRVTGLKLDATFGSSSTIAERRTETPLLALPWREFSVNVSDGSFRINNRQLIIKEVSNSGQGTGLNVWDGSIALALYLERHPEEYIMGKDILEVGAGTGLVGIAASFLGAKRVVLTDLEYAMANLQRNIDTNRRSDDGSDSFKVLQIDARVLDWFDNRSYDNISLADHGGVGGEISRWVPDIILASDVVWVDSLVLPLVQTLHYICSKAIRDGRTAPLILLSYQCRSRTVEELLFHAFEGYGFAVFNIPKDEVKSDRIQVFRITYTNTYSNILSDHA